MTEALKAKWRGSGEEWRALLAAIERTAHCGTLRVTHSFAPQVSHKTCISIFEALCQPLVEQGVHIS